MNTLVTIIGTVLSILSTIAIFILTGIKNAQADTNKEIKELTKDLRDVLVSASKTDEKLTGVSGRVDVLHDHIKSIDSRVLHLEQN